MNKIIISMLLSLSLFSCKKEEGVGGKASITGKVYVKDYNDNFTTLNSEYYSGNEDVYIIYGDDAVHGDKVETTHDGTYQFEYLRTGSYTVFVYSKDSLGTSQEVAVSKVIEVSERKENVTVEDIVIFK